jgi:hypothetical protein
MFTEIKDDLFDIVRRLKEVDAGYRIFWNNKSARWEVHQGEGRPDALSMCFVVPYAELDERTVEHARRTRFENLDDIEREIGAHNSAIEQSARRAAENSSAILADMMDYAASVSHEVVFTGSKRWF